VSDKVAMTPEGYAALQEQLKKLKGTERPKISAEIGAAAALGDLSENAEYHAAREKQGFIEARIRDIDDKLARAEVIDGRLQGSDKVTFGATVVAKDLENGEQVRYRIVGEDEADVKARKISYKSPIARAFVGKARKDIVEVNAPRGLREFQILDITFDQKG
jgi:transcription elongation factor GreA